MDWRGGLGGLPPPPQVPEGRPPAGRPPPGMPGLGPGLGFHDGGPPNGHGPGPPGPWRSGPGMGMGLDHLGPDPGMGGSGPLGMQAMDAGPLGLGGNLMEDFMGSGGPMGGGHMGGGPMGGGPMGGPMGLGLGGMGLRPPGMMGGLMDGGPMGPDLLPGLGFHGPGGMSGPGPPPPHGTMYGGSDLAFGFDSFGGLDGGLDFGPGRGRGRGGGGRGGRGGRLITGPVRGEANDYCQHFVDTGQRPQNFLRDVHLTDRYEEYPKLRELVVRKDELTRQRATPAYYMKVNLREARLSVDMLGSKFDVVLVDPPWEEYARRAPGLMDTVEAWPWQDIMALDIEAITDSPSFVFLWCGSAEGLDAGRHCLRKWGFRRCEDICWIKTNADLGRRSAIRQDAHSVLQHTKEHCLMGIKGTVRRAADGHIIHSNVDTDIIVAEEPPLASTRKPDEIYAIIERFSLGRRRLELFGEDHNIRAGWVTLGAGLSGSNFNPQVYASHFLGPDGKPPPSGVRPPPGAVHLLGTTEEIESLRPKSPPPPGR